jgi:hypothetical protein
MPTSGTYVKRSAMAVTPTCTRPITGTSVPRYQSQPTSRNGRRRRSTTTAAVTSASRSREKRTATGASAPGCEYMAARSAGHSIFPRYAT